MPESVIIVDGEPSAAELAWEAPDREDRLPVVEFVRTARAAIEVAARAASRSGERSGARFPVAEASTAVVGMAAGTSHKLGAHPRSVTDARGTVSSVCTEAGLEPFLEDAHRIVSELVEAVDGRGLLLVDALSSLWGVDPTPTGKAVWAQLGPSVPESTPDVGPDASVAVQNHYDGRWLEGFVVAGTDGADIWLHRQDGSRLPVAVPSRRVRPADPLARRGGDRSETGGPGGSDTGEAGGIR